MEGQKRGPWRLYLRVNNADETQRITHSADNDLIPSPLLFWAKFYHFSILQGEDTEGGPGGHWTELWSGLVSSVTPVVTKHSLYDLRQVLQLP